MTAGPRSHRRWRDLVKQLKAQQPNVCHICRQPIDLALPGTHPWGAVGDHVRPLAKGGALLDPNNVKLAHATCNGRKGARWGGVADRPETSRDW